MQYTAAAIQHANASRLIRGAITLLRQRGLYTSFPGYVGADDSLNIPAAILLAHTRKPLPPAEFSITACLAQWGDPDAYFRAHQPVMDAIRFLSVCVDGEPNEDMATGEPDYIDHLAWWPTYRPVDAQTPPSLGEVLDVMAKAADTAEQIATAEHATAA